MSETRLDFDDAILPVRITHECEQIWNGDSLEQEYNFLVYEFVTEHHTYRARAYLDQVDTVAIYGPEPKDPGVSLLKKTKIDERVLAYLRRRYSKLKRLGSDGYDLIQ